MTAHAPARAPADSSDENRLPGWLWLPLSLLLLLLCAGCGRSGAVAIQSPVVPPAAATQTVSAQAEMKDPWAARRAKITAYSDKLEKKRRKLKAKNERSLAAYRLEAREPASQMAAVAPTDRLVED